MLPLLWNHLPLIPVLCSACRNPTPGTCHHIHPKSRSSPTSHGFPPCQTIRSSSGFTHGIDVGAPTPTSAPHPWQCSLQRLFQGTHHVAATTWLPSHSARHVQMTPLYLSIIIFFPFFFALDPAERPDSVPAERVIAALLLHRVFDWLSARRQEPQLFPV